MSDIEIDSRALCPDGACTGLLDEAGQCQECGAIEDSASDLPSESATDSRAVDMAHRQLCPDGACNGILGSDGCCKECGLVGKAVTSDPRLRGLQGTTATPDKDADDDEHDEHDEQEDDNEDTQEECPPDEEEESNDKDDSERTAGEPDSRLPANFTRRRLCPDGSCIGVVATNGRCPECGSVA